MGVVIIAMSVLSLKDGGEVVVMFNFCFPLENTADWASQAKRVLFTSLAMHSENSPVTQTTPEPTLLSWEDDHMKIFSLTPGHAAKPGLITPFRPHCFRTLWDAGVPRTPNLLEISSDFENDFRNGFFGTLHKDLNIESNFYDHY